MDFIRAGVNRTLISDHGSFSSGKRFSWGPSVRVCMAVFYSKKPIYAEYTLLAVKVIELKNVEINVSA